jgi:hypothetical protein
MMLYAKFNDDEDEELPRYEEEVIEEREDIIEEEVEP